MGGGLPPPVTQFAYRPGYGPTGILPQPFGFVADNTPFGMGNVDHTSSYVVITSVIVVVPEPETDAMLFAGLGLPGLTARRRKLKEAAA